MRKLAGLILLLTLATQADDAYRTFTAQDGRTLKARILSYDSASDKVEIQREDKKKLTVSSSAFSETDQTYIKKWHVSRIFSSETKLKLEIERIEVSSTKKEHDVDFTDEMSGEGGGRRGGGGPSGPTTVAIDKKTQYKYQLALVNKSDVDLNNITMEYRIFYEQQKAVLDEKANKGRREDEPRPERYMAVDQDKVKDGKLRVKPLEAGSSKELSTGNIVLIKRSANRPWGDKIDLKCNLTGAWIKLTMKGPDGDILTREIATSTTIPKKYTWDVPEVEQEDDEIASETKAED